MLMTIYVTIHNKLLFIDFLYSFCLSGQSVLHDFLDPTKREPWVIVTHTLHEETKETGVVGKEGDIGGTMLVEIVMVEEILPEAATMVPATMVPATMVPVVEETVMVQEVATMVCRAEIKAMVLVV